MITRQAILFAIILSLLTGLSACTSSKGIVSTQVFSTSTPTATSVPSPTPVPATPTPLTCLSAPGQVKHDVVTTTKPPQEFLIYLPPCYEETKDEHYPVLYLLHGQTYNQDQWVRMGTTTIADELIHSNQAAPFIIVFPDDRYWNSPAGSLFGERFIHDLIPYVDENYRTIADRKGRSLGGLSRGGGWTAKLGFDHVELFGAFGLHSPAFFKDNAPYLEKIIQGIPDETRPRLWMDIGDADTELTQAILFDEVLTRNSYIHEFHRYAGDHTETYWSAHLEQYLRWYVQVWAEETSPQ